MINKFISSLSIVCTIMTCLFSLMTSPVHAATLPAGFTESIVFSGLTQPTAVRFSPDGRVFVTEKSGLIKVFANLSAPHRRCFMTCGRMCIIFGIEG